MHKMEYFRGKGVFYEHEGFAFLLRVGREIDIIG